MNRIQAAFQNNKAFIPFITAGDPDIETSEKIIKAAADNGADIIEIGIPFSDPTAEGPVIQGANLRALQKGITTDKVFEMVKRLRESISIPLVFMTYANVVYSYGKERFMERCKEASIDGLILPDVPYEEREEFAACCEDADVALIPLVAPTSNDRIAMIAKEAKGFVYIVSSLGVTGVRSNISTDIEAIVKIIRENTTVPCAVGFGISTPDQAAGMAAKSDGAIVGSAIIKIMAEHGKAAPEHVAAFVKEMSQAVHAV